MAITTLRTPRGYCTEEDIENYLLTDINDSFSPQINNWIATAEDEIDNYLGYTTASGMLNEQIVAEVSSTAVVDENNDLIIYTRKRPINSVEKIELIAGTEKIELLLTSGDETRYNIPEPKSYIYYPEGELNTTGSTLALSGFRDIKYKKFLTRLSYTAGYELLPGPINMATIMIVSDFIMRHENKNGLSSITQGRVTKEYFQRKGGQSDLRLDAYDLIKQYKMTSGWLLG